MPTKVSFIGHTHRVKCWFLDETEVSDINIIGNRTIDISGHDKVIINVGSIGQPRGAFETFDPRAY